MAVTTVDAYGAPSYGPMKDQEGIVFHTPENPDITLASAIAVARWQATASNTSGGSYHGILGYDSSKGSKDNPNAWVMVRSVPWNQSSGGVTSRRDSIWAPDRFPWIKAGLSAGAYADPNAYLHQISLSGKAAWYVTNGYPKGAVIRLAEWIIILEQAYKYDALMTLHRFWQTNRSDPGPTNLANLVLTEYLRLKAPQPEPGPTPAERLGAKNTKFDAALAAADAAIVDLTAARARIIEGRNL